VSAIPGHTQAFHFYTIQRRMPRSSVINDNNSKNNSSSSSSNIFRLVDVPGLGYVDTVSNSTRESWKSLITRYLTRRENCRLVLHLVDSRQLLMPIDQEIIRIVARSLLERNEQDQDQEQEEGEEDNGYGYRYMIVLTKVDKCKLVTSLKNNSNDSSHKNETSLTNNKRKGNGTTTTAIVTRENPVDENTVELIQQEINEIWQDTIHEWERKKETDDKKTRSRSASRRQLLPVRNFFHFLICSKKLSDLLSSFFPFFCSKQQTTVEVIQTSSLAKSGIDVLWKNILNIF
jgi:GTP-binding protein EngB required for normal cell division